MRGSSQNTKGGTLGLLGHHLLNRRLGRHLLGLLNRRLGRHQMRYALASPARAALDLLNRRLGHHPPGLHLGHQRAAHGLQGTS